MSNVCSIGHHNRRRYAAGVVGPNKGKAGARAAIHSAIAAALLVFGTAREKVEELEEIGTEATEKVSIMMGKNEMRIE